MIDTSRPEPVGARVEGPIELGDRTIRKMTDELGQIVLAGIHGSQLNVARTAMRYART